MELHGLEERSLLKTKLHEGGLASLQLALQSCERAGRACGDFVGILRCSTVLNKYLCHDVIRESRSTSGTNLIMVTFE